MMTPARFFPACPESIARRQRESLVVIGFVAMATLALGACRSTGTGASRPETPDAVVAAAADGASASVETPVETPVETQGEEPAPNWSALAAQRLPMLKPCPADRFPPALQETLLCGSLTVAENRAEPGGRSIDLNIVVVPAQAETPPADPVFVFEGGPGGAATKRAMGSVYAGPVRARDIVLVDQRGTGGSNPLVCERDADFRVGELREMYPVDEVRACATKLAEIADTSFYTTDHFVDDIEEVRQWLGYGPINIRGGSYGTSSMMTFAQRHPDSSRTLFGIGSTSPVRSSLAERGVWTDRTLERLADACAEDEDCVELTPNLDQLTALLLAQLEDGPRRIEMPDPGDAEETLSFDVGRDWLGEQLRLILYYGFTSRALPWAVHRAHEADDWRPLVTLAVLIERSFQGNLAMGLTLTVQCAEGMNFDIDQALARGARTLVGNYRLEQQIQGCANWDYEPKPKLGVETPRPLEVPTLFLSGALDPVTPPEYSEDARQLFPNSHHLILPEGQHGPFDLQESWVCVHQIWAQLLDEASVDSLDTSCAEAMKRQPFLTDDESFRTYVEETLVGF